MTVDFWGAAPSFTFLWPQAARGAPLAAGYVPRELLGRRVRPVGAVGLLPELNGRSFETEEYTYIFTINLETISQTVYETHMTL